MKKCLKYKNYVRSKLCKKVYIYKEVYRACTNKFSQVFTSSPRVESNQSYVTCFELIRSHLTRLLVRRPATCSHRLKSHIHILTKELISFLKHMEKTVNTRLEQSTIFNKIADNFITLR